MFPDWYCYMILLFGCFVLFFGMLAFAYLIFRGDKNEKK